MAQIDKVIVIGFVTLAISLIPPLYAASLGLAIYGLSCVCCGMLLMLAAETLDRRA